jgi:hypothetical protein
VNDQALATTLEDREGVLASKIEELLPGVVRRFDVVAIQATTATHPRVLSQLQQEGGIVLVTLERDPNRIGRHRREALRMALAHGKSSRIVYMDFDHLLRWIENDASELDRVLKMTAEYDCAVIGRGPRSLDLLPERLASTEAIINHVYHLMTGHPWDVMMAARSFSRRAAQAIVEGSSVDSIGNDVAWPLYCEARGLWVGYVEAEGLTYRTNADYASDLVDRRDGDPRAWAERVLVAAREIEAMLPYMEEQRG